MKKLNIIVFVLLNSLIVFAQSSSVTYTSGNIPTTYITSASVSTSSNADEPGLITVTIPTGNYTITSVDVSYQITATNGSYMSEQRSFLKCVSTGGSTEFQVYSGVGNSAGTYSYSRTGLAIANNVTGGGNIEFELHAFRTYGGFGSNADYQYVNNNTFSITVYYTAQPDDVSNFTSTTKGSTQIELSWTKNENSDNTIIAYNTSNSFGTPTNGTSYDLGDAITNGGTIIYKGSNESKIHFDLSENTQYYYKIWSFDANNRYSIGVTTNTRSRLNPVVSNVTFSITGEYVDIYYDLTGGEGGNVAICMEVSDDGGSTFDFPATQVTGDIGAGVSYGTNKHISWHFGREHSGVSGDNFIIRVIADDLFGDQVYYAGQIYNTIEIGNQTWLKENLNIGTMINSTTSGFQQTNNGVIEKYCYGNNPANCEIYGGLYEWPEAMQYVTTEGVKGICPDGWHIPTIDDFANLSTVVNDKSYNLIDESETMANGYSPTNISGFSALIRGWRNRDGSFDLFGYTVQFWSSTEVSSTQANGRYMRNDDQYFYLSSQNKDHGFNIRCIKD
ncbi:MAG: hypothetical protein K8F60_17400 [Melioribacteraceae bacterium]|nr:hypothetical protein [Melioribacteraceae bacterium]